MGACPADAPYEPPLVIDDSTYGLGIFRGRWQSTDPDVPALTIRTSKPIVIEDSRLRGPGDLIRAEVPADLVIRNSYGAGVAPQRAKTARGNFLQAGVGMAHLVVEHCTIEATKFGVYIDGFTPGVSDATVTVRYNRGVNLNGRYIDTDLRPDIGIAREYAHFVQFNHFGNVPHMEIAWNEAICEPQVSAVDAFIDLSQSGGTADSPVLIHDNFFQGGYASDPTSLRYSGGGISFNGSTNDSVMGGTSFTATYDNQIVSNANHGINVAAGHDHQVYRNRTVSTGRLADGRWMASVAGNGIVVWNGYGQPESVFFNNRAFDNVSGWVRENAGSDSMSRVEPPLRVDYYLPSCMGGWGTATSACTGNVGLPDPITDATERAEQSLWQGKLTSAAVTLGAPLCQP